MRRLVEKATIDDSTARFTARAVLKYYTSVFWAIYTNFAVFFDFKECGNDSDFVDCSVPMKPLSDFGACLKLVWTFSPSGRGDCQSKLKRTLPSTTYRDAT